MFKNMDLYKGIILASILLLPVSLGYLWWIEGQRDDAERGLRAATAPKGEIEKIGEIIRKLDTVEKNLARGGDAESYRVYFERKIMGSASEGISSNDFTLGNETPSAVPGSGNTATDQTVSITFKRAGKEFELPRDFVHAVAMNCEAGGSQIWKLRTLKMRNAEVLTVSRSGKAPPKTVEDKWRVERLEFARREPSRR